MPRPRLLVNALSVTQGGARSYAVNLIRELDRDPRGFDVTVLLPPGDLASDPSLRIRRRAVALPQRPRPARVLGRVLYEELVLPVAARRHDLLYCFADMAPPFALAPVVVAARNLNIYDRRFYDTWRLRSLCRLSQVGLRRARRIVVPSRAAGEMISASSGIPPESFTVVPHGISSAAFRSDVSVPSGVRYVFLPAALERHKNVEVLIEALRHVEDPALELWIAGSDETDPAYASELRSLARGLGVAERTRFLGRVPYEEVLAYYRGAVALVFPSLLETFGHPLLEAMLASTPIVASEIPSFREIAEGVARFFPPRDPLALAREIDAVVQDPDSTKRAVARGQERAAEYSWERSVDALCRVFDSVLEERAGS